MSAQSEIIIWAIVLIVMVVVGGIAVAMLKRRLIDQPDREPLGTGGLLDELRAAHGRGELTDEEFAAAREKLLAAATGRPVSSTARGGDGAYGVPVPRDVRADHDHDDHDDHDDQDDPADGSGRAGTP